MDYPQPEVDAYMYRLEREKAWKETDARLAQEKQEAEDKKNALYFDSFESKTSFDLEDLEDALADSLLRMPATQVQYPGFTSQIVFDQLGALNEYQGFVKLVNSEGTLEAISRFSITTNLGEMETKIVDPVVDKVKKSEVKESDLEVLRRSFEKTSRLNRDFAVIHGQESELDSALGKAQPFKAPTSVYTVPAPPDGDIKV